MSEWVIQSRCENLVQLVDMLFNTEREIFYFGKWKLVSHILLIMCRGFSLVRSTKYIGLKQIGVERIKGNWNFQFILL